MTFPKLIQLLEAVPVDEFLQMAVMIVAYQALIIEDHHLAVLGGIGFPLRQALGVGIAGVGEIGPCAAHEVGESQIPLGGLRQLIF